jgi:hypothetical protein
VSGQERKDSSTLRTRAVTHGREAEGGGGCADGRELGANAMLRVSSDDGFFGLHSGVGHIIKHGSIFWP